MPNKIYPIKNILVSLLIIIGSFFYCSAQTKEYQIDVQKSKAFFSISHMGFLTVDGRFDDFSGTLVFNSKEELIAVDSKIDVKSIDTEDKTRDKSLISKAYLDAETYPFVHFNSILIKTVASSNTITGFLEIKGVRKKINMPFKFHRTKNGEAPFMTISTILKRSDFNLDFGPMNILVGNDIKINLEIYRK